MALVIHFLFTLVNWPKNPEGFFGPLGYSIIKRADLKTLRFRAELFALSINRKGKQKSVPIARDASEI